ncbi:helix-turn-helix domain-containing protein [Sulfobacillus thermosulfidooxidans]|uniref:helix-turn-helix domain-containing protein n=1 Tax=Sulfobacillus thermosulfidooxidans TaxID=28034 RepID=UPI000406B88D|nr:helix-turn-helix domain-containing protein [Sulfobacillus thermosulfidooxidans]
MAEQMLIPPGQRDVEILKQVAEDLAAHPDRNRYVLVDDDHRVEVKLPASLVRVLMEAASQLAKGNSVAILHYEEELTTQQAADLLRVSRPYLIKLLEKGQIRYHYVGSHRRIRMGDLLDYKRNRDSLRKAHVNEMVRVSESLGLYESDDFVEREP